MLKMHEKKAPSNFYYPYFFYYFLNRIACIHLLWYGMLSVNFKGTAPPPKKKKLKKKHKKKNYKTQNSFVFYN